jgi:hypothetical protein
MRAGAHRRHEERLGVPLLSEDRVRVPELDVEVGRSGRCRDRVPIAQESSRERVVTAAMHCRVGEIGQHPFTHELSMGHVGRIEDPKQMRVGLREALLRECVATSCHGHDTEERVRPERQ